MFLGVKEKYANNCINLIILYDVSLCCTAYKMAGYAVRYPKEEKALSKRRRIVGSVKSELIAKSLEAALTAIRTFNDPQVSFKSETFIV